MQTGTQPAKPVVFVVDDDVSVRESLESLIADAGWRPEVFASAVEFLDRPREALPSCLVLDVSLPDLDGLEVQKRIADRTDLPAIFITGHGDIPMTVRAMKAGAVEFLTKRFATEALLSAIREALERSRALLAAEADLQVLRSRYESLTLRERQVMALVVRGELNKQVGGDARVSAVDVRDIAAVAAVALTEPGHIGRTYTITGPSAVTHAEIGAAIAAAIGRTFHSSMCQPKIFRRR
jgi:FixJ family two-component response regulator